MKMLFWNVLAGSFSKGRYLYCPCSNLTQTVYNCSSNFVFVTVRTSYQCVFFNPQRKQSSTVIKMPAESDINYLRYVKLSSNAHSPSKGSEKAAGFDLRSAYNYTIQPRSKEMVKTDLQVMLPDGCYGRIAPRSGLAWKNSIDIGAGVVDEDYRGDIRVILFNHSDDTFSIQAGDRIAQLICERIFYPKLQEVQELNNTKRGSAGFGSTGTN